MTTYRCRTIVPTISEWFDVDASTPNAAAQEFHDRSNRLDIKSLWLMHKGAMVEFARIEVEGHNAVVSRMYNHSIRLKGGVKQRDELTIKDIADRLGWTDPPEELLESGWVGEETMDEAWARKWK